MIAPVTPQERKLRGWVLVLQERIQGAREEAQDDAEYQYCSGYLKALERVLARLDD